MRLQDSSAIAAAFLQQCGGERVDAAVCRATAAAITRSYGGNLGKRAGALCAQLGFCSREQACADLRPLDLCTQQGFAGGDALYTTTGVRVRVCLINERARCQGQALLHTHTHATNPHTHTHGFHTQS
jgi:hypothetical protein